jgi:hypothetical protein
MNRTTALLLLTALATLAAPVRAASPRDELLRLVPADISYGFLLQDLRRHSAELSASPFAEYLARSPFADGILKSPEARSIAKLEEFLKPLGLTADRLRDDWFGDAVVFAFRHSPSGKADEDQGFVMTWLREPAEALKVIERLNKIQTKSGELKEVREIEFEGAKYTRRVKSAGKDEFVYLNGNVMVFSSDEAMVRLAAVRDRNEPPADTSSPTAQRLAQLGVGSDMMVWWMNPRQFDADLKAKATAAKNGEAAFLKNLLRYWSSLDGVAVVMNANKEFEFGLSILARKNALPEPARKWLDQADHTSPLWQAFPEDAMFAAAGRFDFAAMAELVGEFLTPEADKKFRTSLNQALLAVNQSVGPALGSEVLALVLASLGPDWGLAVSAPANGRKDWCPDMIAAVGVRPDRDQVPFRAALTNAVNFLATSALFAYNSNHSDTLRLENQKIGDINVRTLVSANEKSFPPGCKPCFGLRAGYLVFASSPEAIQRCFPTDSPIKPAAVNAEVPLFRASFARVVAYLKGAHSDAVTRFLAESDGMSIEEARKQIQGTIAALEAIDRIEMVQKADGDRAAITFRLRMTQPLKK